MGIRGRGAPVLTIERRLYAFGRDARPQVGKPTLLAPILPVLRGEFGLRQARYLPRLGATAIPVDLGVAERHETQGEVAALEALRVPGTFRSPSGLHLLAGERLG